MLYLNLPDVEEWDEKTEQFLIVKGTTLQLEHSLVSISKWESKWHKAFLTRTEKTPEETIDYVKCMTLTQNVDPAIYDYIALHCMGKIYEYVEEPMTATTFYNDKNDKKSRDVVTAELIYYWMIALEIPVDFQKWHINRLLTLVRVCNLKNKKPQKMSKGDIMRRNSALNAARKAKLGTSG